MTTKQSAEQYGIAQIIVQQINASAATPLFMGCAGAKNLVALKGESIIKPGEGIRGGLMFRATCSPGAKVIIELTASDTYDVQIGRVRGADYRVIANVEGVYCDQLAEVIAGPLGLDDFTN
jgi:hypothetical protein